MKYAGTLLAVKDISASKQFYQDMLGLNVVADFGTNVTLAGGIVLRTLETWKAFIHTDEVAFLCNAGELYFETENIDEFCKSLEPFDVCYVHKLYEHPWGQRVIRIHDPDGHIIEVAEKLDTVIQRFSDQGLTPEKIAARMDIPLDFVILSLGRVKYNFLDGQEFLVFH